MREIKFRAYNKHTKKMYEVEWLSFRYNLLIVSANEDWERKQKLSDFELMQYTGLKDINWKEIYEGDIVDTYDDNWDIENNWIPWLVLFKNCCFHIFDDYERLRDASAWHWSVLIIWNIYENPKLLTK